jgi:hypothetical protein
LSTKHTDIAKPLCNALYSLLNNFVFKEVDWVTLTGTSGTATVIHNGVTKTATWHTSLTVTASDFVTANAADYLTAGSVLTSSGAKLIFTANVPGVGFTGGTSITNATLTLAGTVAANDVTYPIFLTKPKPAPQNYIWVGGVLHNEDGTKDDYMYNGTVQVQVVTDQLSTPETSLASDILNVIRGLICPARGTLSVSIASPLNIVVFTHESYNEMTESDDICKVTLIDLYSFLIQ